MSPPCLNWLWPGVYPSPDGQQLGEISVGKAVLFGGEEKSVRSILPLYSRIFSSRSTSCFICWINQGLIWVKS